MNNFKKIFAFSFALLTSQALSAAVQSQQAAAVPIGIVLLIGFLAVLAIVGIWMAALPRRRRRRAAVIVTPPPPRVRAGRHRHRRHRRAVIIVR
jgi:hypothetical protein